ncbi:MAG: hypothetical protein OZSIB_2333 [Candidatus Ozemobacter sibiricus]|uniref:Uncharacterized protein n=1 Tax=Candidatus Ozemobacter sibiricus TaxID=2268124 RepID=A0A367ZSE9_9BACT|nr:MAG: hypothetical protein OZSIB_2333 [Candidatus Ozemobacter sibiricus]
MRHSVYWKKPCKTATIAHPEFPNWRLTERQRRWCCFSWWDSP